MGVDINCISGIGIKINDPIEIIEKLKIECERDEDGDFSNVDDALYAYNDVLYNSNVKIAYGGGFYNGNHSYFILIDDLFKNGIDKVQEIINVFIEWLRNNNFDTNVSEISFSFYD